MTRKLIVTPFILSIVFLTACNNKQSTAEKFMDYMNNYQIDQLKDITTDDFEMQHIFTGFNLDKDDFIEKYIKDSKNQKAKHHIISSTTDGLSTDYVIEDQNEYAALLKIDYSKLKFKVTTNTEQKVESVIVDTIKGYQKYTDLARAKLEKFQTWLMNKYPDDNGDVYDKNPELAIQRLREYAKDH